MAFHVTTPVTVDEGVDNLFVWDFSHTSSPNRAGSTFTMQVRNLPISQGGTVIATLTVDMANAATGFVTMKLAAAGSTMAVDGAFWELKEVQASGFIGSSAKGTFVVDRQVTA